VYSLERGIHLWLAVKALLFRALLFSVVTPRLQASAETELWRTTMEANHELIYSLSLLYLVQNKNAVMAEWPSIYWLTRWRELLTSVSPEPSSPSDGCLVKSNKGLCIVFSAQTQSSQDHSVVSLEEHAAGKGKEWTGLKPSDPQNGFFPSRTETCGYSTASRSVHLLPRPYLFC